MSDTLTFTSTDRVAIVAPHPDDESIATGGLIQAAHAAGAAVRVIVLTDGDANVWPQRWIEKRWRIDAVARARWGARRREEARQAMRVLGLHDGDTVFFGLPDLGLTALLMRADTAMPAALRREFATFAPTCVVLPSLGDRHPDHSAANILVRLALLGIDAKYPRLLEFAVHGGVADGGVACELDARRQDRKRAAILAHATQMRLSGKRFLRYAGAVEIFRATTADAAENPHIPLRARADNDGRLRIELDTGRARRGSSLFVVMDGGKHACRWLVPWKSGSAALPVFDAAQGKEVGTARIEHAGKRVSLALGADAADWRLGFVKLACPEPGLWVFDRDGWQVIVRT
ncbi:MAG TPA: PIG-L family deacetylase [Rudaea sp.]|nr:PIG-L family deacetylase [Rudaea sp.]